MAQTIKLGSLLVDTELQVTGFKTGLQEVMNLLVQSNEIALKLADSVRQAVLSAADLSMKVSRGQAGTKAAEAESKIAQARAKGAIAASKVALAEQKVAQERDRTRVTTAQAEVAERKLDEFRSGAAHRRQMESHAAAKAKAEEERAIARAQLTQLQLQRQMDVPKTERLARLMSDTRRVVLMIGLLTGGIMMLERQIYREFTGYQDAMAGAAAVTEATKDEIEALNEEAMRIGRTTIYSATEAAKALYILGQAGFRASDTIHTLGASLTLAAAAGVDTTKSVEAVVAILNQFRLPTTMADQVADIISSTEAFTLSTLPKLRVSMRYVGSVAGQLNLPFSHAATAVGMLANAGFEASIAGTQLRGILMRLAGGESISAVRKGLKSMNIELAEVQERMGDMPALIKLFEERARDLGNEVQVVGALYRIFGLRAGPGMTTLMRYGADEFERMLQRIEQHGVAARIAAIRTDTLTYSVKQLWNVIKNLEISFSELSARGLRKFIDGLTELLRRLDETDEATKHIVGLFGELSGAALASTLGLTTFVLITADVIFGVKLLMAELVKMRAFSFLAGASGLVLFGKALVAITAIVLAATWVISQFRDKSAEAFKDFSKSWWGMQQMEMRLKPLIKDLRELKEQMDVLPPGSREAATAYEKFNAKLSELITMAPELSVMVNGIKTDLDALAAAAEDAFAIRLEAAEKDRQETIKTVDSERREVERWIRQYERWVRKPAEIFFYEGAMRSGKKLARMEEEEYEKKKRRLHVLETMLSNLREIEEAAGDEMVRRHDRYLKRMELIARVSKLITFGPEDVDYLITLPKTDIDMLKRLIEAERELAQVRGDLDYASELAVRLKALDLLETEVDVREWMLLKFKQLAKEKAEVVEQDAQRELDEEIRKQQSLEAIRVQWRSRDLEGELAALDERYKQAILRTAQLYAAIAKVSAEGQREIYKAAEAADIESLKKIFREKKALTAEEQAELEDMLDGMTLGRNSLRNQIIIRDERDRARSVSRIVREWGKRDLAGQIAALDERRAASEATLRELELDYETHKQFMKMIEEGYEAERERIVRDTNQRIFNEWTRRWGRIPSLVEDAMVGPMKGFFGTIVNEAEMASYSLDRWFEDLKRSIAEFLASEAAKDLMQWMMKAMGAPGAGGGGWGFWGTLFGWLASAGGAAASGGTLGPMMFAPLTPYLIRETAMPETQAMARAIFPGGAPPGMNESASGPQIVHISNRIELTYQGRDDPARLESLVTSAVDQAVQRKMVPELRRLSRQGVTVVHKEGIAFGRGK